jgi:hypothetical protein
MFVSMSRDKQHLRAASSYVFIWRDKPERGGTRQMDGEKKNKGGRPPMGPKSGKGATLATRITVETRAAIEQEAERTGRSISQVAELWLEEAYKGRADYLQRMGGDAATAMALERLVELARAVKAAATDPYIADFATQAAWQYALPTIAPRQPRSDEERAKQLLHVRLHDACVVAVERLEQAPSEDPVRQCLERPLDQAPRSLPTERGILSNPGIFGTGALFQSPEPASEPAQSKKDILLSWAPNTQAKLSALKQLRQIGDTAATEIDRAAALAIEEEAYFDELGSKLTQAVELAEQVVTTLVGPKLLPVPDWPPPRPVRRP